MRKLLILLLLLVLVAAWWFELGAYLNLEQLREAQWQLAAWRQQHPWLLSLGYLLVYVLFAALALPGAWVLTLAGGAVFGLVWGLVLTSFASSIGASVAFVMARYLGRSWFEKRFAKFMARINDGLAREGAFYLFGMRLVPLIPFFVINLGMGLSRMRLWTFYWVSQLGMLAGTLVYVNAGTALASIQDPGDIFSPMLWLSFALLALFPWLAKRLLGAVRARKSQRPPL